MDKINYTQNKKYSCNDINKLTDFKERRHLLMALANFQNVNTKIGIIY